jgi:hypothetical protein
MKEGRKERRKEGRKEKKEGKHIVLEHDFENKMISGTGPGTWKVFNTY